MQISVLPAEHSHPLVLRLIQLYLYDLSEHELADIGADGHFVDVGPLLFKSIDSVGLDNFKEFYQSHISTPDVVFTNDDPHCLFSLIINEICSASKDGKTTFLIHTGALEGTGIENVNIMEHKSVMSQGIPLVIFYPATYKNDDLLFLNHKPASKYRCKLVK